MINNKLFDQFAKTSKTSFKKANHADVVMYTRVSSKDQQDHNCSLETQRIAIEGYAEKYGLNIIQTFGGTYESAKTDGRKEFQRMLDFIKKNKGKVSSIVVYNMSRFSRTGGQGIAIAQELREKHGVHVLAITQPLDTSTSNGVFFQDIHLIFSKYDNEQRKQNAVAGMKTKFNKGEWVTKPPVGYSIIRENGNRKIVVNDIGKLLKKAFEWKSKGMKNIDILQKLKALGLKIYKQNLTKVFANPFYCGIMCHGMLDGRIIEGNHEKLISQDLFLKVNQINSQAPKFGVNHSKEQENLPLKKFIFCSDCNMPFTGYIVKKKNIYYYKCRTTGCKCNKNATQLHKIFEELLSKYQLEDKYLKPFLHQLEFMIQDSSKENIENEKQLRNRLKDITAKIENLDEKFYINEEIDKDTFNRLSLKLKTERATVSDEVQSFSDNTISNLSETIKTSIEVATNLNKTWGSGALLVKENLQKLVFPDGILFDKKIDTFRTLNINSIFTLIKDWTQDTEENKKGQISVLTNLSPSAERARFVTTSKSMILRGITLYKL